MEVPYKLDWYGIAADTSKEKYNCFSCCYHSPCSIEDFLIKFPHNACSDWLKHRALSEIRERVDDIKLAFKFLLRNLKKFDPNYGKSKESDLTDTSANTLADTPPTCWSTHYRCVGRLTTDASADTPPTRKSTHYTLIKKLTFSNCFVTSFSWPTPKRNIR